MQLQIHSTTSMKICSRSTERHSCCSMLERTRNKRTDSWETLCMRRGRCKPLERRNLVLVPEPAKRQRIPRCKRRRTITGKEDIILYLQTNFYYYYIIIWHTTVRFMKCVTHIKWPISLIYNVPNILLIHKSNIVKCLF